MPPTAPAGIRARDQLKTMRPQLDSAPVREQFSGFESGEGGAYFSHDGECASTWGAQPQHHVSHSKAGGQQNTPATWAALQGIVSASEDEQQRRVPGQLRPEVSVDFQTKFSSFRNFDVVLSFAMSF